MNIFFIPSWYPSKNNPIYGTFVKEQIELLAQEKPDWNIGISLWGQGDPDYMLWVKDHLFNIIKLGHAKRRSFEKPLSDNATQYFKPCLTWTRKISQGNIKGLFQTNEHNFNQFRSKVGQIDIIHAQASYPGALIAEYLSQKYNIPYVVTIRMSPFPFKEFLTRHGKLLKLISYPLKNANRLIATSHSLQKTLVEYELSNSSVIHNPVDTKLFQPIVHNSPGIQILAVGRLEFQKGFDLLLQAITKIPEIDLTVRIGGAGSQKHQLKRLSQTLNIDHKVEWLGELSREQVAHEMQHCNFYVLSSRHETFGNVILEALACGKPVVATKCGGPADIITEENGFLCESENVLDLANYIEKMCHNYQDFSSETIRNYILTRFSPKAFSENMERVYSSVISGDSE